MKELCQGMVLLSLLGGLGIPARAQCPPAWVVAGLAGTNGAVNVASWWDRDGSGPLPPSCWSAARSRVPGA